jgi:DNA-binding beta-propeller fold protein YncE
MRKCVVFSWLTCILSVLVFISSKAQLKPVTVMVVPSGNAYSKIDTAGISILPSGRFVSPAGKTVRITHDPFGMAISPDGTRAVTLHNGVFTIIDLATLSQTRVPSYDKKIVSPLSHGSFLGVAFAKDSRTVYLSGGDNGAVIVYDVVQLKRLDSISLNGRLDSLVYQDSFTSDLVLNEDRNELLVLDRANFRLVRIDLGTRRPWASIKTGRQPFGLTLDPQRKLAFVANVGMYEYPLVTGANPSNYDSLMIPWHPYANNSNESINGTVVEGKKVPGVGSPHVPEAMSVFQVNLENNLVTGKFKTGRQIGQMIEDAEVVGGASPNSIAAGGRFAYVSNANNDNISVIDYRTGRISGEIPIQVDARLDRYRGLLPFGLTLSKDEKTLYVALLGFNAIAVIDVEKRITKGLIPTGWGPARVLLSGSQKELYVISCRGLGAGPNGGKNFKAPVQGTYIGDIQLGTFQKIDMPDSARLAAYTRQSMENTFRTLSVRDDVRNPVPPLPGLRKSPIRHIVYITKENRTYDEVLGQVNTGRGDASLARFGMNVDVHGRKDTVRKAHIMPNHIKIAGQFSYSDNFYCDSDASIHGHHWMMGVIPNEWVEANSSVDKTAMLFSPAPGRRSPGSTGSMDPEDYAEIGGLWEALDRKGISFYNFGEANETAHVREEWNDTLTGAAHGVMVPMQEALWSRTSHNYAGYNTNIPDQFRMEQFEKEFTRMWLSGKDSMPRLITMQVPNDHGAGPRPEHGYPYLHSYMADNDLAIGRILHFLSRTPYWKNMLVIITEDDPQGGVDHVDAHRSILMMAGPYVKRNYVSHTHANFGSILKLIYNILDVPYVNQYDVTASLLNDFFMSRPDYSPYTLEVPDKRVFDAQKAMDRYDRNIDWRSIMQGPSMDNENEQRSDHYRQKNKNQ